MAIIQDVNEIYALIPTFKDLSRCGNFASVEDELIEKQPLYAFVVSGYDGVAIKHYKVKFVLLGLVNVYALILTVDKSLIGRYCDFVGIPRDITKPITPYDWKWSEDAIGLSLRSDNASNNVFYFGTDENDIIKIREGLNKKYRREKSYPKLELDLRNVIIESLKAKKPVNVMVQRPKREMKPIETPIVKDTVINVTNSVNMCKCLPAPSEVTKVEERKPLVDYDAIVNKIVTTEIVYAD